MDICIMCLWMWCNPYIKEQLAGKDSHFIKIQIVFFIESENLNTVECFGILSEWFPFILRFNLLSQTHLLNMILS